MADYGALYTCLDFNLDNLRYSSIYCHVLSDAPLLYFTISALHGGLIPVLCHVESDIIPF